MPSWGNLCQRGGRLGQLRAQMAAAEQDDLVQFDKDDPDFVPRDAVAAATAAETNGGSATLHEYHSELALLSPDDALSATSKSAIYRVRRFFDSLHQADADPLDSRSPVPPARRSVLLRRCLHRQQQQQQRLQLSRSAAAVPAAAAAAAAAAAVTAAANHNDSPWPSPARGRRQPPLRDVHSTPDVVGDREGTLSAASSLTNVSTISSSYVGDELDLDDWDEPQEEEPYPDQDWLTCDRSTLQLTVDTRNSSAASSFRSGIHFTARRAASPAAGSLVSSSVSSVGIQFTAPMALEPVEPERDISVPSTMVEEYGQMVTLEDLRDYNSSCLTCGVNWRDEQAGLDCNECGGYALRRPCQLCGGVCSATWSRDLVKSHDTGKAAWTGSCHHQSIDDETPINGSVIETPIS